MRDISIARQNTAACVSLSNIYNVKDRICTTEWHKNFYHQVAFKPPGATTLSRYRREGRLYPLFFPCQAILFQRISFLGVLPKPEGFISGAAYITAQFLPSSLSFKKVFLGGAPSVQHLHRRRERRF